MSYAPYDEQSLFLVLLDHRSKVAAGAARVVLPGPRAQKTMQDIATVWGATPTDLQSAGFAPGSGLVWDVATLAVDARYRSPLVSQGLYQLICTTAQRAGVGWFVSILDTRVYRLFRRQLRDMVAAFPTLPARLYGGSLSVPCWCDVTAYTQRLGRQDPALYELLFLGAGLEAAISPPAAWLHGAQPELDEQSL